MRKPLLSMLFVGFAIATADTAQAQLNGNTELPAGALASADVEFLQTADASTMDQLMLGKRAESRARDPGVHSLAENIVRSYGKAANELRLLAGAKHVDLAHAATSKGRDEADQLLDRQAPLDRVYVDDVERNTDDLIAMYETARDNSQDADIRAFADEMATALYAHKRQVSDLIARDGG